MVNGALFVPDWGALIWEHGPVRDSEKKKKISFGRNRTDTGAQFIMNV